MHPTDHIQIVTFHLDGLDPADFGRRCAAVAPAFSAIPGLRAKAWLADERSNTFGGVYAWASRRAMEAYVGGPLFAGLRADPLLAGVSTRDFAVLEAPTRITRRHRPGATAPFPVGGDPAWAA